MSSSSIYTWLQRYRGIYESWTVDTSPPPPPLPPLSRRDRSPHRTSSPPCPQANGGRAGEPRRVVGAGPRVAAAASAAVALAPAAARLAVAQGPHAPARAHAPGGGRPAPAPAPRALPRRPRRHLRRAPGAALRHGPRRVRLQGPSGGTLPALAAYTFSDPYGRIVDRFVQPFWAGDSCKWCMPQKE